LDSSAAAGAKVGAGAEVGVGAKVVAGTVTTMLGPAMMVASAADFSVEAWGAAGVAVDEFVPFPEDFDRVPGAALDWTFFEAPIAQKIKQEIKN
jgi:hypothetical protein